MSTHSQSTSVVTDIDSLFSRFPQQGQRYQELQRSRAAQEILARRPLLEDIHSARLRNPRS